MKIDKKSMNLILASWMRWDAELWGGLREIQIKFLLERIIKEWSFKVIAQKHNIPLSKIRGMFSAILLKIEKSHGKQFADVLRHINTSIEANELGIESKPYELLRKKVFLN